MDGATAEPDYQSTNQSATKKTQPHNSAFSALIEAHERLHGLLTSLEQRLDNVLRPDSLLSEARGDHLGSALDGQVDVAREAADRVGRIIDRLAV